MLPRRFAAAVAPTPMVIPGAAVEDALGGVRVARMHEKILRVGT